MGPITSIIPVPRRCPVGGEDVYISELRLRDVAELQAVLDADWPDPLDAAAESLARAGDDPKERFISLVPLHEAAETGPPAYGTAAGNAYFMTPEGGACLLWVAGRRHTPGLDPATAARLYMRATVDEIARVWRAAHGVSPLKALEKMLWDCLPGAADAPGGGRAVTWAEMIDELARANHWTYEYIYDLTLSEWLYSRNMGKAAETARRAAPGRSAEELARINREWFAEGRARAKGADHDG